MFCAKLKELKISGECPFSSSAKNNELGDFEERSSDAADLLPISKDVHGKIGEDLPRQKTSRAKVNLHTLGESIRRLACPEMFPAGRASFALVEPGGQQMAAAG
ncbi:guanylate cyclase soluble subunit alpha-3 [Lates japonicus]|uniref:Guanylate cyclase soluble subunit alpha-3 n=1 Tax=Lates japonicus TaxID=270547 RepID=A0AAD3N8C0_LATJO|nr:guanylate cyclase soluble subunit alpha-3 [Lates japonicus]